MAVSNPHRNVRHARESHHRSAEVQDVAVNDVIGTISLQQRAEPRTVNPWPLGMGTAKDPRAEVLDLTIVGPRLFGVDQEVQLNLPAIQVAHHVQQPGFDASLIEGAHNVKHPQRTTYTHDTVSARGSNVPAGKMRRSVPRDVISSQRIESPPLLSTLTRKSERVDRPRPHRALDAPTAAH